MKRSAPALLFMLSVLTLLIAGCTISTYDKLPDNVPKGYVEFYGEKGETELPDGGTWLLHKYENGKKIDVTGAIWDGNTKRRVAVRPGMHTFIVRLGNAAIKVKIDVIEGMIIPVRVIIDLKGTENRYRTTTHKFNLSLRVKNATPFVK